MDIRPDWIIKVTNCIDDDMEKSEKRYKNNGDVPSEFCGKNYKSIDSQPNEPEKEKMQKYKMITQGFDFSNYTSSVRDQAFYFRLVSTYTKHQNRCFSGFTSGIAYFSVDPHDMVFTTGFPGVKRKGGNLNIQIKDKANPHIHRSAYISTS